MIATLPAVVASLHLDPRYALFLVASLVLIVTPGPAVLFIVARSLTQGRRAGLVSALGVGAGHMVHVLGAALGLSALLASSAALFASVKYLGAAYLFYLGLKKLFGRAPATSGDAQPPPSETLARTFRQAALVGLLNPKTALFFLAFLPQFVVPGRGPVGAQLAALGTTFVVLAVVSDSGYATLSGTLGEWLKRHPASLGAGRYVAGGVYCGLGVAAALSGGHLNSHTSQ